MCPIFLSPYTEKKLNVPLKHLSLPVSVKKQAEKKKSVEKKLENSVYSFAWLIIEERTKEKN